MTRFNWENKITHTHTLTHSCAINEKKSFHQCLNFPTESFSQSPSCFYILFLPSFIHYLHQPSSSLPEFIFLIDGIRASLHKSILKSVSRKMIFFFSLLPQFLITLETTVNSLPTSFCLLFPSSSSW